MDYQKYYRLKCWLECIVYIISCVMDKVSTYLMYEQVPCVSCLFISIIESATNLMEE